MNSCSNYSRWFSAYIEDDITKQKRNKIDQHITTCSSCSQTLHEMQQLRQSLFSMRRLKTSASFDVVLQAQLRKERRREQNSKIKFPFFELNWKMPAYASLGVFLVFLGMMVQRFLPTPSFTPQNPNSIAYVIQESQADPGHFVITKVDSTNNRFEITNYVDIDKAQPLQTGTTRRAGLQRTMALPDLRNADRNQIDISSYNVNVKPQIRTVNEFSF